MKGEGLFFLDDRGYVLHIVVEVARSEYYEDIEIPLLYEV